jgi:ribosomal protein S18 acetylase RimI-like enzyme
LKQYRGNGLSKVLLREAIKYSSLIGMQRIQLEVGLKNFSAIRLYKSIGFETIEVRIETQIMELILQQF